MFAKKPLKIGFTKVKKEMGLDEAQIAVVRRPDTYRYNTERIGWKCLRYLQNHLMIEIYLLQKLKDQ